MIIVKDHTNDRKQTFSPLLNSTSFSAFVHTVQLSADGWYFDDEEVSALPYVIKQPSMIGGRIRVAVNPNKFIGRPCMSIDESIAAVEAIITALGMDDCEVRLDRIDIAIDTYTPYDDLWKMMNYLKDLCSIDWKADNSYRVIGDDLRRRSTILRKDDRILEIYNKQIQSSNESMPATRCEFRWTRVWRGTQRRNIPNAMRWAAEKTISTLKGLTKYIEVQERIQGERLLDTYYRESEDSREGRICSKRDFVLKYADYIYTRPSLKCLFPEFSGKRLSRWLYDYRQSGGVLTFISKRDMTRLCRKMCVAITEYTQNQE